MLVSCKTTTATHLSQWWNWGSTMSASHCSPRRSHERQMATRSLYPSDSSWIWDSRWTGQPQPISHFFCSKRITTWGGQDGLCRDAGESPQISWPLWLTFTTFSFELTTVEKQHFYLLAIRQHHNQDTFSELFFHKDPLRQAAGIFAHPIFFPSALQI